MGAEYVKVLFRGLSVKYIFLAITYFCSSYITEEEINDLEKLFYLYYLVMILLREVAIHIQNRLWNLVFPRIRKGPSLCGFDWKKNPEKGLRQWKKVSLSWKRNLCVLCVGERKKNNSFAIHLIILRYFKNVNLPFKKDFKFSEILTKTSFFL